LLQADLRLPVTSENLVISKVSPASVFDCDFKNRLFNITFSSTVKLVASQIRVMFGSSIASTVTFHSDGTFVTLVAAAPATAADATEFLPVTLTASVNSSVIKASANVPLIKCCEDIVAHCQTLGAIATPPVEVDVTFGTKSAGGCDSSVCRRADSVERAVITQSSESVKEDGGLVYFVIRNFPLRSITDVTVTALNQAVAISVQATSSVSANIHNVTARLSPFNRKGPSVALQLSTPFVSDSLRAVLVVVPSFNSDPVILAVLPSLLGEVASASITVTLTNFPPVQNASDIYWRLAHASSSSNGSASVLYYSSPSGDTQIGIQLPSDTKRIGSLNFTLHVWVHNARRGSFVLKILPRSPIVSSVSPNAVAASTTVSIKMAIIVEDFPPFTQICSIFVQNTPLTFIQAATNSNNGKLQIIHAVLNGNFLPGSWPVILSCPPASASFDISFYSRSPIISSVVPSQILNSGSQVVQVFIKNLGSISQSALYIADVPVQFNVAFQTLDELVLQFQSQETFPIGPNSIKLVIPGISHLTSTLHVDVASPTVSPETIPAGNPLTVLLAFFEPRKFLRSSELTGTFESSKIIISSISLRSAQTFVACVIDPSLGNLMTPRTGILRLNAGAAGAFEFILRIVQAVALQHNVRPPWAGRRGVRHIAVCMWRWRSRRAV
jgi:hypothetical protein